MERYRLRTVMGIVGISTFMLLGYFAHAADEALASRDTTSSNLEDIVDGSSNPLVLVDDAMTTFTIKLPTMLEELLRLTSSGEVSATLTVGGIDRATTASVTFNVRNSDTGTMTLLVDGFQVWTQATDGAGSLLDADKLDGAERTVFYEETALDSEAKPEAELTDGAFVSHPINNNDVMRYQRIGRAA